MVLLVLANVCWDGIYLQVFKKQNLTYLENDGDAEGL